MPHILLIEDDQKIADFIYAGLSEEGFSIQHAANGKIGLEAGLNADFDGAIVDIMLPELDGLSLVEQLRNGGSTMPVLFLSGPYNSRRSSQWL